MYMLYRVRQYPIDKEVVGKVPEFNLTPSTPPSSSFFKESGRAGGAVDVKL